MKQRRLPTKAHAGKLPQGQLLYLMNGFDLMGNRSFNSDDEMRAAWFAHRTELMRLVKDVPDFESYGRDSRPWAWFEFEAKLPRQKSMIPERVKFDLPETDGEYLKRLGEAGV
jgi:hypothetical protein